jgi:hypothetical protein
VAFSRNELIVTLNELVGSIAPFFARDDLQFLLNWIDEILRVGTRETTDRHRGDFSLNRLFSGKQIMGEELFSLPMTSMAA